jgi:hypothetical protein
MSEAKIFLVGDDETRLTPMVETAYKTEEILQLARAFLDRLSDEIACIVVELAC